MSKRFRRAYRKASVSLQRLIEGATHDLVRRFREDPGRVKFSYDRLAHLQPQLGLLEVDISGANRMVANVEQDWVHLLDVGGHETVPRYTFGKYQTDKHQKEPAHAGFWPDALPDTLQFFTRKPCESFAEFGNEYSSDWLYFLSAQQAEVLAETIEHVFSGLANAELPPVFIVGGPGTGKTSILINVVKQFVELGMNASMLCSARMKDFIIASTPGVDETLLCCDAEDLNLEHTNVLVVDDPDTTGQIVNQLNHWVACNRQLAVVIGFDPCQILGFDSLERTSGLADAVFDQLVECTQANVFGLDECYRQKENVGEATQKALRALSESTPFLADRKIVEFRNQHLGVNSLGRDFTFPNPHGYAQVYRTWSAEDITYEIHRIRDRPLWTHWYSSLIVVDDTYSTDLQNFRSIFANRGVHCEAVQLSNVSHIKGLEYQHVVAFISEATFLDLERGFQGSGQAKYAQYRLMRVPLSRPKDSLVIFVG